MSNRPLTWLCITSLLALTALDAHAEGHGHEEVTSSCADCPNYSGAYTVENSTNVLLHYQYRWGDKHPWKTMALARGRVETHSYPLGEDPHKKVPTPYLRFDRVGGDKVATWDERRLSFHAVGYAGYGPKPNLTQPTHYAFTYAPNGHDLRFGEK